MDTKTTHNKCIPMDTIQHTDHTKKGLWNTVEKLSIKLLMIKKSIYDGCKRYCGQERRIFYTYSGDKDR